ncbi:unnamed protein product [marine sediment metagenome]|uniref:Uncharacterized protein n=1 Tax=marine sediment metagenome TaxID=412755 RepID=X0TVK0_9ZZZZ
MTSNVKKGQLLEKKARDELIIAGYVIWFRSIRTRFQRQDFANLFDIVAVKNGERLFISVKSYVTESRHKQHLLDVEHFCNEYGLRNEVFTVWFWNSEDVEWDKRVWEKNDDTK